MNQSVSTMECHKGLERCSSVRAGMTKQILSGNSALLVADHTMYVICAYGLFIKNISIS